MLNGRVIIMTTGREKNYLKRLWNRRFGAVNDWNWENDCGDSEIENSEVQ